VKQKTLDFNDRKSAKNTDLPVDRKENTYKISSILWVFSILLLQV
jgi:hypothetical protein